MAQLTERDSDLAVALNQNDNRVFRLERLLSEKETELALLRSSQVPVLKGSCLHVRH